MQKVTRTDVDNLIGWARSHKDDLENRLVEHDDGLEMRRLIRVHRDFVEEVLRFLDPLHQLPDDPDD